MRSPSVQTRKQADITEQVVEERASDQVTANAPAEADVTEAVMSESSRRSEERSST